MNRSYSHIERKFFKITSSKCTISGKSHRKAFKREKGSMYSTGMTIYEYCFEALLAFCTI